VTGLPSGAVTHFSTAWDSTCAVINSQAYCWGKNTGGQLGVNYTSLNLTEIPRSINVGFLVAKAYPGHWVHCFLTTTANLYCAGGLAPPFGGANGALLGRGTSSGSSTPLQVSISDVSSVTLGKEHVCAIKQTNGSLWCWGYNSKGQIGDNSSATKTTPTQIYTSGILQVAAQENSTCALKSDNTVWCWGAGANGALGNNNSSDSLTHVQVKTSPTTFLTGVTAIVAGLQGACALQSNGDVYCWGSNAAKVTGNKTLGNSLVAVKVQGLPLPANSIAKRGDAEAVAILSDGSVWSWGANDDGSLSVNNSDLYSLPAQIQNLIGTPTVVDGNQSSRGICALNSASTLYCWGQNYWGTLGNGISPYATSSVTVGPWGL
jgi:alpha-tubulin suppressor-like RCC1 family protein